MGSINYGGREKEWRKPGMQIPLKEKSRGRNHEDLDLFQDLRRRHIDRTPSLLLPVSDDFDTPQSGYDHSLLQRISSSKRKSGSGFRIENSKHDYDWLKTPPATPLFPSLEMEATVPRLHCSYSQNGDLEASKASNGRPKSPVLVPKPKPIPPRSKTPLQRSTISSTDSKKNIQTTPTNQTRPSQTRQTKRTNGVPDHTIKQAIQNLNPSQTEVSLTPNLSKNMTHNGSKTISKADQNPRLRPTSPIVRSALASQIPNFSDRTPTNLITTADRSTSATRGRPSSNAASVNQKTEANSKSRRNSCSPSMERGRKVELKQEDNNGGNTSSQKKRIQTSNGANILGSKMVEKVMNARKSVSAVNEKETKTKHSSFIHGSSCAVPRATAKPSLFADQAPKMVAHKR